MKACDLMSIFSLSIFDKKFDKKYRTYINVFITRFTKKNNIIIKTMFVQKYFY